MSSGLIFHAVVIVILLIWLETLLTNLYFFRAPKPRAAADLREYPLVSILIPARNEEARLPGCLDSLLAQDYPHREIIVLNDHSTDGTSQVALARGFREGDDTAPLRLLTGAELPAGWTGKGWACHQLSQAAKGEFLLFTDADTDHLPHGLSTVIGEAIDQRIDLISPWPRQITRSWSEHLVIPLIWMLIVCFMPHFFLWLPQRFPGFARRFPKRMWWSVGGAVGQFMLFRRAAYVAIGGHEAVRDHLVEDVALGRRVAERFGDGLRLLNCDGSQIVRCRMYESFPELWEGFSKNIRAAFDTRLAAFIGFGVMQVTCFIVPFLLLPWTFSGAWWAKWVWAEVAIVWLIRGLLTLRFRTSIWSWLLHPVAHLIAVAIALNSWRLSGRKGVRWKGRTYTMGETS